MKVYGNRTDHLSNNLRLNEISKLTFSQFYCKIKKKTIRTSSRSNWWSTPILIFRNIERKVLKKKPADEAFQVSFKLPRRGWDQWLAEFNRFSNIERRSCYSCLMLHLNGMSYEHNIYLSIGCSVFFGNLTSN